MANASLSPAAMRLSRSVPDVAMPVFTTTTTADIQPRIGIRRHWRGGGPRRSQRRLAMPRITCAILAAALLAAGCATREGRAAAQMETRAAAAGADAAANHV